jgi:hypothetical protein
VIVTKLLQGESISRNALVMVIVLEEFWIEQRGWFFTPAKSDAALPTFLTTLGLIFLVVVIEHLKAYVSSI